ncbi:MAG TPA: hypothetical protein VM580_27305 [Labilithrix sp.]|nr:hypothetical protein [Labilithrix sp.]
MTVEILRAIVEDDKTLLLRRTRTARPTSGADETHLELVLGNVVLLSSAALETERHFGRLAQASIECMAEPCVVIGGLGFGATLRGVLEVASAHTKVIVVEKLRTVIDVARSEARELVAGVLDDPRVELRLADVADVITEATPGSLAAILLDVDNGPAWASFRTNARLYADAAVARARTALAPGGVYAVWSGYPADPFLRTLRRAGFVPRVEPLRERGVVRARAYIGSTLGP